MTNGHSIVGTHRLPDCDGHYGVRRTWKPASAPGLDQTRHCSVIWQVTIKSRVELAHSIETERLSTNVLSLTIISFCEGVHRRDRMRITRKGRDREKPLLMATGRCNLFRLTREARHNPRPGWFNPDFHPCEPRSSHHDIRLRDFDCVDNRCSRPRFCGCVLACSYTRCQQKHGE